MLSSGEDSHWYAGVPLPPVTTLPLITVGSPVAQKVVVPVGLIVFAGSVGWMVITAGVLTDGVTQLPDVTVRR